MNIFWPQIFLKNINNYASWEKLFVCKNDSCWLKGLLDCCCTICKLVSFISKSWGWLSLSELICSFKWSRAKIIPSHIPSVTIVLMYSVYFFHSGCFLSNLTASLIYFKSLCTTTPQSLTLTSLLAITALRMLSYS